jgi:cytochrome c-type biogenesis protein CcmH/NrfG
VSFWKDEVIGFALDHETQRHIEEQRERIARDPTDAHPYANLARLYRLEGRQEDALGLLLESVRLDPSFAAAHADLAEIYAVRGDCAAAWRHARQAEAAGEPRTADLLRRHGVEPE